MCNKQKQDDIWAELRAKRLREDPTADVSHLYPTVKDDFWDNGAAVIATFLFCGLGIIVAIKLLLMILGYLFFGA